jgi:hypothetical protein
MVRVPFSKPFTADATVISDYASVLRTHPSARDHSIFGKALSRRTRPPPGRDNHLENEKRKTIITELCAIATDIASEKINTISDILDALTTTGILPDV